jgi:2-polyprenyl-3-methyl-5-hydroxy-6-metoxy-1,4-benzoquinol methylase
LDLHKQSSCRDSAEPHPGKRNNRWLYSDYYTHSDPERHLIPSAFRPFQARRSANRDWCGLLRDKPGDLLEVGAGNGRNLVFLRAKGWNVFGQDIDHLACEKLRPNGIPTVEGSILEATPDRVYDVVLLSHVLEHLPDPSAVIDRVYQLLKPGGKLVAFTPNARSVTRTMFHQYWRGLEAPRHLIIFAAESLKQLIERSDFSVEVLSHSVVGTPSILHQSLAARIGILGVRFGPVLRLLSRPLVWAMIAARLQSDELFVAAVKSVTSTLE